MLFLDLLPPSLRANPVWKDMALAMDNVWGTEVNRPILQLLSGHSIDTDTMPRDDLIRLANNLGWNFSDTFSADWKNNPSAEQFLRRFVKHWGEFCRSKGTIHFKDFIGFMLNIPFTVHVMWTNAVDPAYDGHPEDGFLLGGSSAPVMYGNPPTMMRTLDTYPEVSYGSLVRYDDLDLVVPGWQTIIDDPATGWYPTSHIELEYLASDVPKSDIANSVPEEIIASLFYAIAPIQLVLRTVSVRYNVTTTLLSLTGGYTEVEYF